MAAAAPGPPAVADRPLLGVLLMIGFCMMAPPGDATAKVLGVLPLATARPLRHAGRTPPAAGPPGPSRAPAPDLGPHRAPHPAARRLFTAFVAALRFLPMADAVAILFVLPFVLLLLGRVFLGEAVGPHRLAACALGFLGTLMVVKPSFAEVGAPALLPLLAALFFAFFMLVTRRIARDADPVVLQAASGFVATLVILPALALGALLGGPAELTPVPIPSTRACSSRSSARSAPARTW